MRSFLKNFLKNKKGDGSYSNYLITWIILIASVIVLLAFLASLDYSKTIDEQMCHLSVLSRGASGEIKGVIPFSCKTSKICVTRDGSCDESGRIKEKVSSKEELYELLANKMADCWWMFGEGKHNFVENKADDKNLYCALCYDIVFDDSLASIPGLSGDDKGENVMMLSRIEFYRYLEKHEISKNKTYSQYMNLPSADFLESNFKDSMLSQGNEASVTSEHTGVVSELEDVNIPKIDLKKKQYILMGAFNRMSTVQSALRGASTGASAGVSAVVISAALAGVGLIATPMTGGLSLGFVAASAAIGAGIDLARVEIVDSKDVTNKNFISTIVEGESGDYYLTPTIVSAEIDDKGYSEFAVLGCTEITTRSGG